MEVAGQALASKAIKPAKRVQAKETVEAPEVGKNVDAAEAASSLRVGAARKVSAVTKGTKTEKEVEAVETVEAAEAGRELESV